MGSHKNRILAAAGVAIVAVGLVVHRVATAPSGTPASDAIDPSGAPVQEDLPPVPKTSVEVEGADDEYRITAKARYRVAARVLSTERYSRGWESDLSPVDFALGWGTMADPAVDRHISWSQSNRWYFYRWQGGSPYKEKDIVPFSANTHIIPATVNLRRAVLRVDSGDVVLLEGYLVHIEASGGRYWSSSTSRDDTGKRSCEVMVVERLVVDGMGYE